ncbi:MAG: hypothetical protein IJA79_00640 [Desulfovibrio sp.]|nr:hypothetical protein [Desulfovibrio sp.]
MITAFDIYFVGMLDSLKSSMGALSLASIVIGLVGVIILTFVYANDSILDDVQKTQLLKVGKRVLITALIILTLSCGVRTFLPSSKLAAAMYILPAAANNEDLQKIGGNSLKILRDLTEKWLQETADPEKSTKPGTL